MCGRSCSSARQGERRKSPHFTLPAAPHSRRCFGKLPPAAIRKLRCADGLALLCGSMSERIHFASRPTFPQAFREIPSIAIRKSRCADGIALLRGSMSERIHFASRPAFPQAFRETAPAANRKLRCADGLALQRGRASGGTPRQPPHIPDSVSGNTSRRNPKAAMCGRPCFSARQGERMNGIDAADSPPDDTPRNLPVVGARFDAEYGLRAPLLSKRRARMNNQCILKSSA